MGCVAFLACERGNVMLTASEGTETDANPQLIGDYRRHLLAAGRGVGTVKQRIFHLGSLRVTCPDLLAVTTEDLERWLAGRRRTHQAETRKSMRNSVRSFYDWASRTGRMDHNPALHLLTIYVPQKPGRIAADADVQNALKMATLPERAMILLGRYAALRLSEITTLHTRQREGDVLRILGKGERTRMVPINDELMLILQRLESQVGDDYYFPGQSDGHLHPMTVNKIITRVTGTNPHSLRHAAATAAFRGTRDIRAVQVMLGHASIQTTQRYLHVNPDEVRAAAAATAFGDPTLLSATPLERATFDSPGK